MSKLHDFDKAIDYTSKPKEIHVHKDHWRDALHEAGSSPRDSSNEPVVEGPLGSTKQIGRYHSLPVFSHGKDPDKVYVQGEGSDGPRDSGWFKNGEPTTAP